MTVVDRLSVDRAGGGDVRSLWGELRESTVHRLDEFTNAGEARRDLAKRRLLLALELRWKREEQVLLPALLDSGTGEFGSRAGVEAVEAEIHHLRELCELLQGGALPQSAARTVVGVLEGLAGLRSAQIEQALAEASAARRIDTAALADDMRALLARWRGEIADTGDIEDEEADPVGRPPR